MKTLLRSFVATVLLFAATSAAAAPVPLHRYQFNGSLTDDFAGPSLTANGGALTANTYVFGPNQGLTLENAINTTDYTIVLDFAFNTLWDYNKIIDFKGLTTDEGLYAFDGTMNFYPEGISPPIVPSAVQVQMAVTRDGASSEFRAYLNGALQFSFIDSNAYSEFSGPNGIINFFIDDHVTDQLEVTSGWVDMIRIWDGALSDADVRSLVPVPVEEDALTPAPVPEPSTLLLLGGGGIAIGLLRRRTTA